MRYVWSSHRYMFRIQHGAAIGSHCTDSSKHLGHGMLKWTLTFSLEVFLDEDQILMCK
jgi:hypothetical protein